MPILIFGALLGLYLWSRTRPAVVTTVAPQLPAATTQTAGIVALRDHVGLVPRHDLAVQAVLAAMHQPVMMVGRGGGGGHGGGGGGHGAGWGPHRQNIGWGGGLGWWTPSPLEFYDTTWVAPVPVAYDDVTAVCAWALTAADSRQVRMLIAQYAAIPAAVTCLSQRLAQLAPYGV